MLNYLYVNLFKDIVYRHDEKQFMCNHVLYCLVLNYPFKHIIMNSANIHGSNFIKAGRMRHTILLYITMGCLH